MDRNPRCTKVPIPIFGLVRALYMSNLPICPTKPKLIYRWLGKMEAEREDVEIHLSNPSKRPKWAG